MTQQLIAAHVSDTSAWEQAVYAFLVEKSNRSGSKRTVESYSRMLWPFFGTRTPERVTSAVCWRLYKAELINRRGPWRTIEQVELATARWVDFWNTPPSPRGLRLSAAGGVRGGLPSAIGDR